MASWLLAPPRRRWGSCNPCTCVSCEQLNRVAPAFSSPPGHPHMHLSFIPSFPQATRMSGVAITHCRHRGCPPDYKATPPRGHGMSLGGGRFPCGVPDACSGAPSETGDNVDPEVPSTSGVEAPHSCPSRVHHLSTEGSSKA